LTGMNARYYPGVDRHGINKARWIYKQKTNG
jgi:hypothetical protein